MSLWRRFFLLEQEEEERRITEAQQVLCDVYDVRVETMRPAAAERNREQRRVFVLDGYRSAMNPSSNPYFSSWEPMRTVEEQEERQPEPVHQEPTSAPVAAAASFPDPYFCVDDAAWRLPQ